MLDVVSMFEAAAENVFLVQLAFLLFVAVIGGWLATLIKMPSVLGQIVLGIIIGPTVLNIFQGHNEMIKMMADIGVIFLMFLAGLETDLKELRSVGKGASMIALGGVVVPLVVGAVVPLFFYSEYLPAGNAQHKMLFAIYIGAILTATSVSISVSVLRDMQQLASRQGISILGAAIIDDILGIILLAVITGLVSPTGISIVDLLLRIILFFVIAFVLGWFLAKVLSKHSQETAWRERIISIAIILCFFFAFSSEMFSVAAITGAYIAGVIFSSTPYRHKVVNGIQSIAYTLFIPIFFVSIGIQAEITSDVLNYIGYAVILVVTTILSKVIGCGVGARFSKFTKRQSIQIGIGMVPRAEVALIVAAQGLTRGFITDPTFTSIVLVVVISTLITPPLLKIWFSGEPPVTYVFNEE
jgi:Kef-type K+ transport system membrane component KefB